jgi:hypothetical protein
LKKQKFNAPEYCPIKGYVAEMSSLHDQFDEDKTILLGKCKPYLAQMQDTVEEVIYRWKELLGDALSVYNPLADQPLPTPIHADDKLHYDEYGVLFHHINDKYGPVYVVEQPHKWKLVYYELSNSTRRIFKHVRGKYYRPNSDIDVT